MEFYQVFIFYIGRGLGGDLFEFFIDDPAYVYNVIEKIYGLGATFIFRVVYDHIRARIELDLSFDRFLDIIRGGDREALINLFVKLSEANKHHRSISSIGGGKWSLSLLLQV